MDLPAAARARPAGDVVPDHRVPRRQPPPAVACGPAGTHRAGFAAGASVHPQVTCRPITFQVSMAQPLPFYPVPGLRRAVVPRCGRTRTGVPGSVAGGRGRSSSWRPSRMWIPTGKSSPSRSRRISPSSSVGPSIPGQGAGRGPDSSPCWNVALADNLETRFRVVFANDNVPLLEESCAPTAVCSGCPTPAPTSRACATRPAGRLPRQLGPGPGPDADRAGRAQGVGRAGRLPRADRSRLLKVGQAADIVVFDLDDLDPGPLPRVRDFPAGSDRLTAERPRGLRHVLVNGAGIRVDGDDVRATLDGLPGTMLSLEGAVMACRRSPGTTPTAGGPCRSDEQHHARRRGADRHDLVGRSPPHVPVLDVPGDMEEWNPSPGGSQRANPVHGAAVGSAEGKWSEALEDDGHQTSEPSTRTRSSRARSGWGSTKAPRLNSGRAMSWRRTYPSPWRNHDRTLAVRRVHRRRAPRHVDRSFADAGNGSPIPTSAYKRLAARLGQRDALRLTAYGLTDEQARATPREPAQRRRADQARAAWSATGPTSVLERRPIGRRTTRTTSAWSRRDPRPPPRRYDEAPRRPTRSMAAIADLDQPVPVPKGVPWFPDDVDAWSVRWVLLHLIEETARHAGHADIVREAIDGATAFPLMAAAEGWPATPWLQPWEPPSSG